MLSENLWDAEVRRGAVVTRSSSRAASRAIWVLLILFVSLQVADVVTTNYALAVPGNWEYGNFGARLRAVFYDKRGRPGVRFGIVDRARLCRTVGRIGPDHQLARQRH